MWQSEHDKLYLYADNKSKPIIHTHKTRRGKKRTIDNTNINATTIVTTTSAVTTDVDVVSIIPADIGTERSVSGSVVRRNSSSIEKTESTDDDENESLELTEKSIEHKATLAYYRSISHVVNGKAVMQLCACIYVHCVLMCILIIMVVLSFYLIVYRVVYLVLLHVINALIAKVN